MPDYVQLKQDLISLYSKQKYNTIARSLSKVLKRVESSLNPADKRFLAPVLSIIPSLERYKNPDALDAAIDAIDLPKIFAGVDEREQLDSDPNLQYQDHVVLETLRYFKHDFFKWVTKPKCTKCGLDGDNIVSQGTIEAPQHNPHLISRIETYVCRDCGENLQFPRYNDPIKLLETRIGRCGEWVNCFMLVLQAVLGVEAQIRYLWNREDHVWCEYYSISLKRWVHLDPCEAAFDEPSLYCENWGKKMSWVLAIGEAYIIDVSTKYITKQDKAIPKSSVVFNAKTIEVYIKAVGFQLMIKYFQNYIWTRPVLDKEKFIEFYYKCLLPYTQETVHTPTKTDTKVSRISTRGRQTGGAEWTQTRGENGN